VVELTHLVGELNHQSTYLAELCKPPHFTVQASYAAPEVAEWEARNEAADIWSLGCVHLDMLVS